MTGTSVSLEFIASFAGNQRLDDAVFLDRLDQLLKVLIAKHRARLERRRHDARKDKELDALTLFNNRSGRNEWRRRASADECAETFAECDSFGHRGPQSIGVMPERQRCRPIRVR